MTGRLDTEASSVQNVGAAADDQWRRSCVRLATVRTYFVGDIVFMDTHGEATAVAHADHEHAVPETGLRFEKSELGFFVDDDRYAGKAIGKLLAVVFMISFILFSSVCAWMMQPASYPGHDPQAGIGDAADTSHH